MKRKIILRFFLMSVVIGFVIPAAMANQAKAPTGGVSIGRAKIYDSSYLHRQLEQLYATLASSLGIKVADLKDRVDSLQQSTQTATSTGVGLTTSPVASMLGAGTPQEANNLGVGDPIGLTEGRAGVSSIPYETLLQRLNLEFDILNLSYGLTKSVEEQVNSHGSLRPTLLLGIPISISPGPQHRNHVAEVIVTIKKGTHESPPVLGVQLPRARTYNVQRIVRGQQALSLGAVTRLLSLGVDSRRQSDDIYLVRDFDVVSLGEDDDPNGLRFSWQIRPVMGQPSIEPGVRTLMASVAMPTASRRDIDYEVQVIWRPYNKKDRTVEVLPNSCAADLLRSTLKFGPELNPRVTDSRFVISDDRTLVQASVTGEVLLDTTRYFVGPNEIGSVRNTNAEHISLTLPATALFQGGIHGISVSGERKKVAKVINAPRPLMEVSAEELPNQISRVVVNFEGSNLDDLREELRTSGLLLVGEKAYHLERLFIHKSGFSFAVDVPSEEIDENPVIAVASPFATLDDGLACLFSAETMSHDGVFAITSIEYAGGDQAVSLYAVKGRRLSDVCFEHLTGGKTASAIAKGTESLVMIELETANLAKSRYVRFTKSAHAFVMHLPEPKAPEKPKPAFVLKDVNQGFEGLLQLEGTRAKEATHWRVGTEELEFVTAGDAKFVKVPKHLTVAPGEQIVIIKAVVDGKVKDFVVKFNVLKVTAEKE